MPRIAHAPIECRDCKCQFDRRGSQARKLCRRCYDIRKRKGIPLPDILCPDCGATVEPRQGFRDVARCEPCQAERDRVLVNARARERRRTDPEYAARVDAASEAWGRTKNGRRREYAGGWRQRLGPEYEHLTVEHLEALLEAQRHRCAICEQPIEFNPGEGLGTAESAHLDHCHDTHRLRGWLCSPCNRALGGFRDSVELVERALGYLKERAGGVELPDVPPARVVR